MFYRKLLFLSLLLSSMFFSVGWKTPELPKLTSQQWETLNKGEIILTNEIKITNGEKNNLIGAYLIYSKPITTVWNIILHPEKYDTVLPDLYKSPFVKKTDKIYVVDNVVKIAFIKIKYRVVHYLFPEQFYLNWTMDPNYDNDLKYFYGEWQFYPLPNGKTLGKYLAIVNTSSLIPGFIERKLTRDNIPKNMEAFKKWVDSGGKWHK